MWVNTIVRFQIFFSILRSTCKTCHAHKKNPMELVFARLIIVRIHIASACTYTSSLLRTFENCRQHTPAFGACAFATKEVRRHAIRSFEFMRLNYEAKQNKF